MTELVKMKKVLVYNPAMPNNKKAFESSATTFGELKRDLIANGVTDLARYKITEGRVGISFETDAALLPTQIKSAKGDVTDNLVLIMTPNKIDNGLLYSVLVPFDLLQPTTRKELFEVVRIFKEVFGKDTAKRVFGNHTTTKTVELLKIVQNKIRLVSESPVADLDPIVSETTEAKESAVEECGDEDESNMDEDCQEDDKTKRDREINYALTYLMEYFTESTRDLAQDEYVLSDEELTDLTLETQKAILSLGNTLEVAKMLPVYKINLKLLVCGLAKLIYNENQREYEEEQERKRKEEEEKKSREK